MKIKFSENSTGHDIIDDIVVKNRARNESVFQDAQNYPPYFGGAKIGEHKVKLKSIRRKDKLGKSRIIQDIVEGVNNFKLDDGVSSIKFVNDEAEVSKEVNVHPIIIKLIKTCVAVSYNANEDFSIVVTAFIHELISHIETLNLPLQLPTDTKTQKVIAAELNEYLKELCDDNNITYHEIVEGKATRKKESPLIAAAKKAIV